jgi:hypothetical protein
MQVRLSITSNYSDTEKGVSFPDIEISKEFEGRTPTAEELEELVSLFRRCIVVDTTSKPKVRELGSA